LCIGLDAGMDVRLFFGLAVERGFVTPAQLIGADATLAAVRAKLVEMAAVSEPGDLFLLTFSGHGGRTRLPSGEVGTWQLYDGALNEEKLTNDLSLFRKGVRVLVVSDNCGGGLPRSPQSPGGSQRLPSLSRPAIEGFLKASVLVLAACEQGKYADGEGLPGHFAAAISRVLNNFDGSYAVFHHALMNEMPSYQKPDFYRLGKPNVAFEEQQPFAI
jgi:hypothetical protein